MKPPIVPCVARVTMKLMYKAFTMVVTVVSRKQVIPGSTTSGTMSDMPAMSSMAIADAAFSVALRATLLSLFFVRLVTDTPTDR